MPTEKEVADLLGGMFNLPPNYVEWEVFSAAFANRQRGVEEYEAWIKKGRPMNEMPEEVVTFCQTELARHNKNAVSK